MSKDIHEDLRIIKTKKALQSALINLLKRESFENIKVSEICNESIINRSTFYAHYNDKFELFTDTINTLKDDLASELKKKSEIKDNLDYIMKILETFLTHVEDKKDIYIPIMYNNKNSIIMDMIINALEKDLITNMSFNKGQLNSIPIEIIVKFYAGAIFSAGMEWLSNFNKYSKEEIQKYLEILIKNGITFSK